MRSMISLDYETYGEVPLGGAKSVGVWNYTADLATEALMVAYRIDNQQSKHVDLTEDDMPREAVDALTDPHVEKWAFNATFERLVTRHVLGIDTPISGWRCSLALAHLQSFSGDLLQIGKAMGVDPSEIKDKEGDRLIKLFAMPQKITRKNGLYRRTSRSDPDDWDKFCAYNIKDEVAETSIRRKLLRYEVPEIEWQLYELDQEINDRGMNVNVKFVQQATRLTAIRRAELVRIMQIKTGLNNPNSGAQLLPWLQDRGYPFSDLQKATVKKVLAEHKSGTLEGLLDNAATVLELRQQASKTSPAKYDAMLQRVSSDNRLRHCFQFAGAARTARWAGRGPQPHNLTRTPKELEAEGHDASKLEAVAQIIESGDYEFLKMTMAEPMEALAGSVRSSFQANEDHVLIVCDLSAIESAVSAWLFNCKRLLRVFRDGLDPYKDFGVELYHKPYDGITKAERTICKPAVLGCTYQLGGGDLVLGKRTGLWGYAENMGVDIAREEAHRQVKLYRSVYPEIPEGWKQLEIAARQAVHGQPKTVGRLHFEMKPPYLTITLPSGRPMYYYKPKFVDRVFVGRDGEPYTRNVLSYMGMVQGRHAWGRIYTSGGKLMENVVQATARDVLTVGMLRARKHKFPMVGSVHDEIITEIRRGSNFLSYGLLRDCMREPISWAPGLPLGAAGYTATIYRKD